MKFGTGAAVLGVALFGAAALIPVVSEGRAGNSGGRGRCGQTQSQCRQLNQNCPQDRQQLRDGSCGNANCPQPGAPGSNCPGPAGVRPGTGPRSGPGAPPAAK